MKNMYNSFTVKTAVFTLFTFSNIIAFAQQAVTTISSSYVASTSGQTYSAKGAVGSGNSGNTFTYNFGNLATGGGNGDLTLNSFVTASGTYTLYNLPGMSVKIRRNDLSLGANFLRYLKYDEGAAVVGTSGTVNIGGSYVDDMEQFFLGNTGLNSGSDNLFQNTGDGSGNVNNIERVDFIFSQGIFTDNNNGVGVALFERGVVNGHDPVKVALILSMGGALNTPTRFSDVVSLTSASYGTSNPVGDKTYVVARRDVATETNLLISTTVTQGVGGVYIPFGSFTVDGVPLANGTRINGYVILPNDFSGNRTQIQDFTNATYYPTNTAAAGGGIDLTSITGIFRNTASSVNITLALTLNQFSASLQNRNVQLSWSTEKEVNASRFEIERSVDGKQFSSIKSVQAKNASVNNYVEMDAVAGLNSPQVYYRLKMLDKDGTARFSNVIVVTLKNEIITGLSLSPSVVQADYTIAQFEVGKAGMATIQIISANGQVVQQLKRSVNIGRNSLNIDQLGKLSSGAYAVQVIMDNTVLSSKLLKQ